MEFLHKHVLFICLFAAACVLFASPHVIFAAVDPNTMNWTAGNSTLTTDIVSGNGGAAFNNNLKSMLGTAQKIAQVISTIMICLGGLMVAMNVDGGTNKLLWNSVLGIGLALAFASFLGTAYNGYVVDPTDPGAVSPLQVPSEISEKSNANTIVQMFEGPTSIPSQYKAYTIYGAAKMIKPAMELLLVLTAINASIKIALDMVTGDKIKYLTEVSLQTGVFLALIWNWYGNGIDLMGSLISGFEQMGITASGIDSITINGKTVQTFDKGGAEFGAGNFFGSAWQIINFGFSGLSWATSPLISFVCFIIMIIIMILLFLTGIELLMARFEFWTMAMLTIPLLGFAGLPQTKYLFDNALKAMLSLAVKTCVIAFLGALTSTIMLSYVQAFDAGSKESSITGDMPLLIQCLLMALLMYVLTKQIPQMVQGLLNGTPNITGASMTSIAKQGLHTGAKVGGAVASGGATLASGIARGAYKGAKKGGSIGYKAVGKGGAGVVAGAVGGVIGGALGALDNSVGMVGGAVGQGAKSLLKNNPIGSGVLQGVESGHCAFNHAPFSTQAVKSAKTVKNAIDKIMP